MSDSTKSAASIEGAAAAGAGGGAALGALSTLFQQHPSLRRALRNALLGGAGGALIGGGVHALGQAQEGAPPRTEPPPADAASTPKPPGGMDLRIAAVSGLAPGIGPALHGFLDPSAGPAQVAASGAASLASYGALARPIWQGRKPSGRAIAAQTLLSVLGAVAAAEGGNRLRASN